MSWLLNTSVSHVQYLSFPLQVILCILACDVLTAMAWIPQPIPLCRAAAVGYSTNTFFTSFVCNTRYLRTLEPTSHVHILLYFLNCLTLAVLLKTRMF